MCRRTIFLTLHSHVSVVSRLVFRKGMDLLVGIIPIVCRHLPFVDFVIGGDGPKMLNLQEMVERERLQDRVEFLGSVPHASVRDALVRGHVFLSCSLTESFCIAILEAASCGLLVVSTNVGGVPEVLPENMILLSEPNLPSMVNVLARAVELQPE
jgi:phosphatidylinositol glycan class A protein